MSDGPLVVAITGASGAPYAVRLLEQLAGANVPISLIVSSHGWRLLSHEAGIQDIAALRKQTGAAAWDSSVTVYDDNDRGAPPASGSAPSRGMVICPCSMGTLSAVSNGASRSLIERAADVALKERRRVVLVPRETPLSAIHLRNMLRVTVAGAVVLPAAPGFYAGAESVEQLVDFIVARVLDSFKISHTLSRRWSGEA
ncbi:MAG TPA: flavin prenyltransferase UbiX [Gemmatimonadaceae bacterium]|nr:flavin prenyltransferase UbiX [Gemmatimonadaceae bacterium]